MKNKIVIIIPTFNERRNIVKLLKRINGVTRKVKHWQIKVLIVDDNSPDGTAKVVQKFMKRDKKIHLLVRAKKVGLGAAYLAGMNESFQKLKADYVITMDADLSHKPQYLPPFIKALEEGADLVIGSRYIKGGSIPKDWAFHRKVYSVLGNKVASLMLGTNEVNDWTSGYRAIKKEVYKKNLPEMRGKITQGYTFNMSFAYHTFINGFSVRHVAIKFPDRKLGKSKLGMEYLIKTPIFLIKTRLKLS